MRRLYKAQSGICAGCGKRIVLGQQGDPRKAASFDHVIPRSEGGRRVATNGLLKHAACNEARGNRPANGCDLIWHLVVSLRLTRRGRRSARSGANGTGGKGCDLFPSGSSNPSPLVLSAPVGMKQNGRKPVWPAGGDVADRQVSVFAAK
ncbi:HNH endonuclease [Sphingomonas changnyeongensis]